MCGTSYNDPGRPQVPVCAAATYGYRETILQNYIIYLAGVLFFYFFFSKLLLFGCFLSPRLHFNINDFFRSLHSFESNGFSFIKSRAGSEQKRNQRKV